MDEGLKRGIHDPEARRDSDLTKILVEPHDCVKVENERNGHAACHDRYSNAGLEWKNCDGHAGLVG